MNVSSVRRLSSVVTLFIFVLALGAARVDAQTPESPVELGAQVSFLRLSEFDITDVGVGVTAAWHLSPLLAIDGTLAWFPGERSFEDDALASQNRVLGLVGVRSGITRGRVDFFGRARAGFLRFAEQDSAICILIFPAPVGCTLSSGYTAFAMDLGGGAIARIDEAGRWRLRVDVGDLIVRYDVEGLRPGGEMTDGFTGHNLLTSVGLVWGF